MDQKEKSNEQSTYEFDFHFVKQKDEEAIQTEVGTSEVLKSEVVASRLKFIAKSGNHDTKRERLVFDLQTGKLTVELETAQHAKAKPDRLVMEELAASGWFAGTLHWLTAEA